MRTFLSPTAALCLALVACPGAFAQSASAAHGSQQMHRSMMGGMEKMKAMQSTGNTDNDFATMMRMHHQQAVEMAKAEIEHGKSPELKAMAQKIIKDQQKEIAQFDQWLAKNK